jgi:uncharacterized protein (TIGR01777 family)
MKVAIPGGTGLIGRNLISKLKAAGHEPVILTRDPTRIPTGMSGLETRRWRIGDKETEKALEGVGAVVNLAGEPIVGGRWTEQLKRRIRESRILGTAQIVSAMKKLREKPEVFVAGSAVGYYGSRGDDVLGEDEGPGGDFLAGVCRDLEGEAMKAESLGVRVILSRTAPVLSMSGGALAKMLAPFRLGLGGRIGSGRQWFPWIHESDIAGAILFCLENTDIRGAVNVAAPGIVRNSEFTGTLAKVLSRPAILPIPVFALKILFGEMATILDSSIRAVPDVVTSAGYSFGHPSLQDALRNILFPTD